MEAEEGEEGRWHVLGFGFGLFVFDRFVGWLKDESEFIAMARTRS